MKKMMLSAILGFALVSMAAPQQASAVSMLSLDNGVGGSVSITDNGVGDLNPLVGAVTWSGTLGVWTVNVSTGVTKPILGSAGSPHMDLNSVNVSTAGGTMTIMFTDTDFTGGVPNVTAATEIGGTTSGTVAYSTFLGAGNLPFQNSNGLTSQLFTTSPFAGTAAGSAHGIVGPYSLTQKIVITHKGAGSTSFDASAKVPEPTSLLLLGSGLVGFGILRRKNA